MTNKNDSNDAGSEQKKQADTRSKKPYIGPIDPRSGKPSEARPIRGEEKSAKPASSENKPKVVPGPIGPIKSQDAVSIDASKIMQQVRKDKAQGHDGGGKAASGKTRPAIGPVNVDLTSSKTPSKSGPPKLPEDRGAKPESWKPSDKPESKTQPQTKPHAKPQPQAKPHARSQPQAKPSARPKSQAKPQAQPQSQARPKPISRPPAPSRPQPKSPAPAGAEPLMHKPQTESTRPAASEPMGASTPKTVEKSTAPSAKEPKLGLDDFLKPEQRREKEAQLRESGRKIDESKENLDKLADAASGAVKAGILKQPGKTEPPTRKPQAELSGKSDRPATGIPSTPEPAAPTSVPRSRETGARQDLSPPASEPVERAASFRPRPIEKPSALKKPKPSPKPMAVPQEKPVSSTAGKSKDEKKPAPAPQSKPAPHTQASTKPGPVASTTKMSAKAVDDSKSRSDSKDQLAKPKSKPSPSAEPKAKPVAMFTEKSKPAATGASTLKPVEEKDADPPPKTVKSDKISPSRSESSRPAAASSAAKPTSKASGPVASKPSSTSKVSENDTVITDPRKVKATRLPADKPLFEAKATPGGATPPTEKSKSVKSQVEPGPSKRSETVEPEIVQAEPPEPDPKHSSPPSRIVAPSTSASGELAACEQTPPKLSFWKRLKPGAKNELRMRQIEQSTHEVIRLVQALRDNLESNTQTQNQLLKSMEHLPKAVKGMDKIGEATHQQKELLDKMGTRIEQSVEHGVKLNLQMEEAFKHNQSLNTEMAKANVQSENIARSMEKFNDTLHVMDGNTKAMTEQFNSTLTNMERTNRSLAERATESEDKLRKMQGWIMVMFGLLIVAVLIAVGIFVYYNTKQATLPELPVVPVEQVVDNQASQQSGRLDLAL